MYKALPSLHLFSKDVGMDEALYIYLPFYILPSLLFGMPSLHLFHDFSFLVCILFCFNLLS